MLANAATQISRVSVCLRFDFFACIDNLNRVGDLSYCKGDAGWPVKVYQGFEAFLISFAFVFGFKLCAI